MREALLTELIDSLLGYLHNWGQYGERYMEQLQRVVEGHSLSGISPDRDEIIRRLKEELLPEEWKQLPELVAERQAGGDLVSLSYEALERRKSEAERRAVEKAAREREEARETAKRQAALAEARRAEAQRKAEREAAKAEILRQAELAHQQAKAGLVAQLREVFQEDFFAANEFWAQNGGADLLPPAEYEREVAIFVRDWARGVMPDEPVLDPQQALAVGTHGGDIEVIARAGAGKTRTLVTRALFLQTHCGANPRDLLLLAFNHKAAEEMKDRLHKYIEDADELPHVMTFHALAYALVHPDEELLYDDDSGLGLSREIQGVIDEHLHSAHFGSLIRQVMLSHFEDDWERIVKGGFHLTIPELIRYRDSLPRETLKGDFVKSYGERLIANTLLRHGVDYKYERSFRWGPENYRPDFTILLGDRRGVAIEYFGLKGTPDYDEESAKKRDFWRDFEGWDLLEFAPDDITAKGEEAFKEKLLEAVRALGVETRELSEEELWQLIERRAVDSFTKAMRTFVSRCRKRDLGLEELQTQIGSHLALTEAEDAFLQVAVSVYSDYLERLPRDHQLDFDGLMWRSIRLLRDGESVFDRRGGRETGDLARMKFVLIDEFQDFSEMFHEMTEGIRALAPGVEFFCVGDDWQAINGFAGSELRFFEDFPSYFRNTKRMPIDTNYRSPRGVVAVGNALMSGHGTPARAHREDEGSVQHARFGEFVPTPSERARHDGDDLTPAVLRLVRRTLDQGRDVVLLSRSNNVAGYVKYADALYRRLDGLPRFEAHIRSFFPEEDRHRIAVSTAHKYKGLQKSTVVILDADERRYPLIHPSWVFLRLFGECVEAIEEAERRLFYVALTRAQDSLVVVSADANRESRYVEELRERAPFEPLEWGALPPVPSLADANLEVRVTSTYDDLRRQQLLQNRFRWQPDEKYWYRTVAAEGFDLDVLCESPWAAGAGVCIDVYDESGLLVARRP